MLVTENGAREKECRAGAPFGITGIPNNEIYIQPAYCCGSDCMQWRWQIRDGEEPVWGYCGLAGKPEE